MRKPFTSAYQRIAWAKEEIPELKARMARFFHAENHERIAKFNRKRTHTADKLKLPKPWPEAFTRLTVHTIEDLRAALDHAASAVVPIPLRKNTAFPFGDTERKFKAALASKCKHVPDEIKAIFAGFRPYKRGNASLWAINSFCNTSKHRNIVEPGIVAKDVSFSGISNALAVRAFSRLTWNRKTNEITLTVAPGTGTPYHDVEVSLGVVFGNVPVFRKKVVLAVLRHLTSITESIVMATEAEARRIGLVR